MKRLLLVVVSLVVVCGALELVLRTTHLFHARLAWTEPDHDIGWCFTPGREYWFFGENDHAITGRINSKGWRDKERSVEKPPHTYRIAVLGDSYVEAFQVEQDSTFCAIAERHLSAQWAHDVAEVMNFGRSGMSPTEESIVLSRDVMWFRPDAVVLLFTPQNDIADVNRATAADTDRPFLEPDIRAEDVIVMDKSFTQRRGFRVREAINPWKQHSALVSLVVERYNAARLAHAQPRTGHASVTREQSLCTDHPDVVFAKNYGLCKSLIDQIAITCQARGIRFILMSVPLVYEEKEIERIRAEAPSFDPEYFDHDLAREAARWGFEFIPLCARFEAASRRTGRPLHWKHWNYDGHRLVAGVLEEGIASRPAPGARAKTQDDTRQ